MIQTLTNNISCNDLGIVLMHEHVFNKYPPKYIDNNISYTLQLLKEVQKFSVKTIIDLTPYNSPDLYNSIIDDSNINIIGCVGFYLYNYIPKRLRNKNEVELVRYFSNIIEKGTKKYKYKPGILKIASSSDNIKDIEYKYFNVITTLQKKYNLPIATHSPKGFYSHYLYFKENKINLSKIYFCHSEFFINDNNFDDKIIQLVEIVHSGAYLLFSKFGTNYNSNRFKQTLKIVKHLIENGYINHILLSSDCNWKWKYGIPKLQNGNNDYSYIFTYIIPGLLKAGISTNEIYQIMVINPYNLLK